MASVLESLSKSEKARLDPVVWRYQVKLLILSEFCPRQKCCSDTGTRTPVWAVRGLYDNHLHYIGSITSHIQFKSQQIQIACSKASGTRRFATQDTKSDEKLGLYQIFFHCHNAIVVNRVVMQIEPNLQERSLSFKRAWNNALSSGPMFVQRGSIDDGIYK